MTFQAPCPPWVEVKKAKWGLRMEKTRRGRAETRRARRLWPPEPSAMSGVASDHGDGFSRPRRLHVQRRGVSRAPLPPTLLGKDAWLLQLLAAAAIP